MLERVEEVMGNELEAEIFIKRILSELSFLRFLFDGDCRSCSSNL